MTTPLTLHTDAVSFTNPTTGWALAGDPGSTTLVMTSDGGASWHALTPALSAPEPAGSSAPSGAPQAAAACATPQLQISTVNTGAAAGTVGGWLRFHNMATQARFLRGWPTVVGVTVSGATVQARYVDMLLDSPNVQGTPTVILEPGDDAFAAFAGGDNPVGSAMTCPPSFTTLRVTSPGATGFASVSAWNVGLGADLPDCAGLEVTMVVPRSLVPYVPLTP